MNRKPQSGRQRQTLATACCVCWIVANTLSSSHASDVVPAADSILQLTDDSRRSLQRATNQGLIEVAPVHLPDASTGNCNHYGWPVATIVDDTIIVMHRRIPGHRAKGAGEPDRSMSYGIVLTSNDGGKTWSNPFDLKDCMNPQDRNRGGIVPLSHRTKFDKGNKSPQGYKVHLHAIGSAKNKSVLAINNHGVFRSDNRGQTWQHISTALRDDTFPHQIINLGPRIVEHPQFGLMAFGNWFGEVDSYYRLSNQFVCIHSQDRGATWQVLEHPMGFPQYEPAVLLQENSFLFVTRDQTKVRAHRQMTWLPGKPPRVIATNLADPRLVDTVDLSLNPVTGRLELVRSERHHMELWLWSMDPDDWDLGQWRRECRLLALEGTFYRDADGFHPAAAVHDTARGQQHVFIYAGHPNGPAGVFRISRSQNTAALSTALNAQDGSASE